MKDNGKPDPTSEYINANWVRGADGDIGGDRRYIAAMGPKPGTVYNFWRMLYLHKPVAIVMITGLVEKVVFPVVDTSIIPFQTVFIYCYRVIGIDITLTIPFHYFLSQPTFVLFA